MTSDPDRRRPERLVPVWETLPVPDQSDPGTLGEGGPGSSPTEPVGPNWEPYPPPPSAPREAVVEPPMAGAPQHRQRSMATWVMVPLALAVLLAGAVLARSSLLHSPVADVASGSGIAAPDPVSAPDPEQGQPSGTPLPGVVAVYGQIFSTTGLVMDAKGTVVVPYHPLANATSGQITVAPPGGPTMDATMAGFDATRDVAVLKVPGLRGARAPSLAADPVVAGDQVDVSGYAIGRFGAGVDYASTASTEVLDTRARAEVELAWTEFFVDVPGLIKVRLEATEDGGVGQGIFASGDLAGLVIDQHGSSAYAVPIDDVVEIVSAVRSGTDSGPIRVGPPGSLGLTVAADSAEGLPSVATVQPFGPAATVGIKEGDLLVAIGALSLDRPREIGISPGAAQRMLKPGSPVQVTWISGASGKQKTATVIPTTASGY